MAEYTNNKNYKWQKIPMAKHNNCKKTKIKNIKNEMYQWQKINNMEYLELIRHWLKIENGVKQTVLLCVCVRRWKRHDNWEKSNYVKSNKSGTLDTTNVIKIIWALD